MTRIEKVIEGMRQMNLEQFLVTDPMAVYYLTGRYYACLLYTSDAADE